MDQYYLSNVSDNVMYVSMKDNHTKVTFAEDDRGEVTSKVVGDLLKCDMF